MEDKELAEIREKKMKEYMKKMERGKMELVKNVNESNFEEEVIKTSENVVVVADFWASWCKPCRMLGPVLEEFAKRYEGKFVLAKINVDENPVLSRQYGIRGIPAVKMFKNGQVIDEFVGALPAPAIKEWLDNKVE